MRISGQSVTHDVRRSSDRLRGAAAARTSAPASRVKPERDAEIAAKKAEGKSNRQIAREVGVDHSTVVRACRGAELQGAKTHHPAAPAMHWRTCFWRAANSASPASRGEPLVIDQGRNIGCA
jgi:DNA-binding CsgD family transcriptional regulator